MHHFKTFGKSFICRLLEAQVKRLRRRHKFTIVGVVGSVGKTSTKLAVARVLEEELRVCYQKGNYNDRATVPLVLFNQTLPGLFNILAWLRILIGNERIIRRSFRYDVAVLELGTDGPGQIAQFAYLQPELVIVTSITPEHMEYFHTIEAVAREELSVATYAKQLLINSDDVPGKYLKGLHFQTYGLDNGNDFYVDNCISKTLGQQTATLYLIGKAQPITLQIAGKQGAKIALAAAACAHILGFKPLQILDAVAKIEPFAGRMQILPGIRGSQIIDDTYNASPVAVKAALDVLYGAHTGQRIAILGSMNELGDYSPQAHQEVGAHCDPAKLALVITIGADAEEYLAPVAKSNGCQVESFMNPIDAGTFVAQNIHDGAVVLAKGSQNRVFAEEAIKPLLRDPSDAEKLVRQSTYWLRQKEKQFN